MDKPVIFSALQVRALLEGRKTQDRRVLKKPTWAQDAGWPEKIMDEQELDGRLVWFDKNTGCVAALPIPQPGDRLWVREAHALVGSVDPQWCLYRASGYDQECIRLGFDQTTVPPESTVRWRPCIHMPRWASRLTLTVTDVRVQRVQEISYNDTCAEGIKVNKAGLVIIGGNAHSPHAAFRSLWDYLNDKRNLGWEANPWVAAYTFTVKKRNIDA